MRECAYKHCNNMFDGRPNKKYCRVYCKQYAKDARTERVSIRKKITKRPYLIHKKDYCEHCGFIPIHLCQLDVDHIDGNHKNNKIENLRTLCANCHRLKTYMNKDWESNNNKI